MRKSNIALYVFKLKPEAVLALLRNVVAKMTGNAAFPDPLVKLADLSALADQLEAAIEAATFGSRLSKLQRNELVRTARAQLSAQAGYVRGVCNGDPVLLESSGFSLAKPIAPLPLPQAPADLQVVRSTTPGLLKVRFKGVRGSQFYRLEMQEEGSTQWTVISTNRRLKHDVEDLTTGKEYSFRVQVNTAAGQSPMSEVVSQKAA